jgi:hypothetical protein
MIKKTIQWSEDKKDNTMGRIEKRQKMVRR